MNTDKSHLAPRQSIALITLAPKLSSQDNSQNSHAQADDFQADDFQTNRADHFSSILGLAQSLTKLGWQIDIVTAQTQPDEPRLLEPSPFCRIVRLPSTLPQATTPSHFLEGISAFVQDFYAFQTKQGTNYPLIHTLDAEAGQVGLYLKQICAMQWVHTIWRAIWREQICAENNSSLPLAAPIKSVCDLQTAYSSADQVVMFLSESQPQRLNRFYQDLNFRSPHSNSSNGSKTSISRADAKRQLGLSPLDLVGLYQGSFRPIAGIDVLIEALALHRDRLLSSSGNIARPLKCLFVCERSEFKERQRIQQRLEELNLDSLIHWVEGFERESLCQAAADLRLLPSLWEPFGTAALSALDCGVPAIASNVDGFRFTIIPEETGLLVPPNDPMALSEAIDQVVFNDMWMQRLRRQTADASMSNWHRTAAHLSDLYRRILAHTLSPIVPQPQNPYILTIPPKSVQSTARITEALMQVS